MDETGKAQRATEPSVIERAEPGSDNSSEKHQIVEEESPNQVAAFHVPGDNDKVTWKTWCVIVVLSSTFGLSFWPIPTTAAMQNALAAKLGDPLAVYWFVPTYTICIAIGFLLAGANSDLFGRRICLIMGEAGVVIGMAILASAKSTKQFQAGLGISGFFGGFCQMSMCAIPELMPNKFRHIGICIADAVVFVVVVIGPVAGRYAIETGDNWQYIFWAGFIGCFISLVLLVWLYHPPKHPKGVPWREAARGADWVGAVLSATGLTLALMGIVYTSYLPSTDVHVIAPLVTGLGILTVFGLWEQFSKVKYKLCPPEIFKKHNGREFTAPFVVSFIVTMFYYGANITWPTMINVFYITPDTPRSEALLLTLPGNLGLVFGALMLTAFGNITAKWITFKWALTVAWSGMLLWVGLMALVTPFNKGLMIAFAFLGQAFFGWAQYASIAFSFFGVHQIDLGVAGGLSGMARFAGGSLAQAIYMTILTNTQASRAAATLPQAAIAAGLPESSGPQLLAAFPLGAEAIMAVPGITEEAIAAASLAFQWSYAHALKLVSLSALSFGGVGLICCCLCLHIDHKMTPKIEIFLENDKYAEKNAYH